MGVVPSSGLMSAMNWATACCAADSFGVIPASTSVLAGMPRSARQMSAHSMEFTHQLITATAASGLAELAEADQSIEALYQAFRSAALPERLGKRRIRIVWPEASFTDWTW